MKTLASAWRRRGRRERKPTHRPKGPGPRFETVEPRLLMTSAPFFVTPLTDQFLSSDGALTFGIDAGDADNDALTITAVSSNPNIQVYIPQGNRYAKLHFSNIVQGSSVFSGTILVQLFDDRSPTATTRFVELSTNPAHGENGDPFYTDVLVHRVVPGFVIQTGDAQNGNGTGGSPLPNFPDVFDPVLSFAGPGALAMANSGPNTNDSQWFITDGPAAHLNQKHMIFGQMISGQDVYNKIINTPRNTANDRPTSPPVLESVEILSAAQNPQDATITIRALNGFLGEAQVTITLNDGTGNMVQQVIDVTSLGQKPVITPAGPLVADGDNPLIFNVTDDGNALLALTSAKGPPVVTVTADVPNKRFVFTVPEGFAGLSRLVLNASEAGFPKRATTQNVYHVLSQNEGDPPVLGRAVTNTSGGAFATQQVGDRLYVANGTRGLEIWNVANPANPVRLGTSQTLGTFRDVQVVGDVAFVVYNSGPGDTKTGLLAFNVANPANISFISGALINDANSDAIDVLVSGNFAYVAAGVAGVKVFNIAQMLDGNASTNSITNVRTYKTFDQGSPLGRADGLAKLGNTLFISDGGTDASVLVLTVTDPVAPTLLSRIQVPTAPFGLAAADNRLYVVDQDDGLMVFDVTNVNDIAFMGTLLISGLPSQVTLYGTTAIVSRFNGFVFVDVSDPLNMVARYRFDAPAGTGLASVSGNRLALPMGMDGVVLMDGTILEDIASFQGKRTFTVPSGVQVTIDIKGGTGRVTTDDAGNITKLEVLGTNEKSTITIKTTGGDVTIGDVFIYGRAKSFTGTTTNLGGDFDADGAVLSIKVKHIDSDHNITIGPSTNPANPKDALTFVADEVFDTSLTSGIPIKSITTTFWRNTDNEADTITAKWIGSLTTKGDKKENKAGDFEANLTLSGVGAPKTTLGKTKFAGTVKGEWNITGHGAGIDAQNLGATFDADFSGDLTGVKVANNAAGDLAANTLKKYDVKGNSTLDLLLDGVNAPSGVALGGAKVGALTGGTWTIKADAGAIAANTITDWTGVFDGMVKSLSSTDIDDMTLDAEAVTALTAKGDVNDSIITLHMAFNADPKVVAMKTFKAGVVDGLTLRSTASLGKLEAAQAFDTIVFAGVQQNVNTLPDGPEDFVNQASIAEVKIKGVSGAAIWMGDVHLAAWKVGKIAAGFADTDNDGTPFGVAADSIASLVYKDAASSLSLKSPQDIANLEPIGDFMVRLV